MQLCIFYISHILLGRRERANGAGNEPGIARDMREKINKYLVNLSELKRIATAAECTWNINQCLLIRFILVVQLTVSCLSGWSVTFWPNPNPVYRLSPNRNQGQKHICWVHNSKDVDAISKKSEEAYFNYRLFRSSKPLGIWLLPHNSIQFYADRPTDTHRLSEDARKNKQIEHRLTYRA